MLVTEVYVLKKFNLVENDPSYFQPQEYMQKKASMGCTSCLSQLCKDHSTHSKPSDLSPPLTSALPCPHPTFTILLFGAEVNATISLFQRQGVAQKAGQDGTSGTESHVPASDDFNAHFPVGRLRSGMYKMTPRTRGRAGLSSSESRLPGQGEPGLGVYSRATLHPHGRHLLLVAMGVEAGHVIVYHLHLLPREVRVLIQGDLVLLAVLWTGSRSVGEGTQAALELGPACSACSHLPKTPTA